MSREPTPPVLESSGRVPLGRWEGSVWSLSCCRLVMGVEERDQNIWIRRELASIEQVMTNIAHTTHNTRASSAAVCMHIVLALAPDIHC